MTKHEFTRDEIRESLDRVHLVWQTGSLMHVAEWIADNLPDLWDSGEGQGTEMMAYIYDAYRARGKAQTGAPSDVEEFAREEE